MTTNITDLTLRDAHQCLLATRLRTEDMLPICPKMDKIGYWAMEVWGGATFDSCIRYLGEDPWDRIREIKAVMPNTPQQMLLRGQNLLGYRHYSDDVVRKFVDRCAENGVGEAIKKFESYFRNEVLAVDLNFGEVEGELTKEISVGGEKIVFGISRVKE